MDKVTKVSRLQGYKVKRLQGYKVTGLQGYKVTRLQGYKVTWFFKMNLKIIICEIMLVT